MAHRHALACFFVCAACTHTQIMVAQAGQPSGWPGSLRPVSHPRLGHHPLERENSWW
ncbi:ash family protein [Serratia liquefaciens]|uniref:ash family protein n=1 Tax=Serratia liquefaciens TaxID=614 RepID=UPI003966DB87